jgi:hypothetical protein
MPFATKIICETLAKLGFSHVVQHKFLLKIVAV